MLINSQSMKTYGEWKYAPRFLELTIKCMRVVRCRLPSP